MGGRPPTDAGAERFQIARGAVRKVRGAVIVFLGGGALLVAALLGLHRVAPGAVAYLGLIGAFALGTALLVYMNLPGWVHLGAEGLFIDQRDSERYIAFTDLVGAKTFTEHVMGKRMIGVELELRTGEPARVLIGENQLGADKRAELLTSSIQAALEGHRSRGPTENAPILAEGERG